ncbi:TetR/AcrR family transcriptional regulator [Paractinoplanes brasiliensis]|uniref:TetR family transcriptional regulator n=1 Tax=Paractinoplanes brasiliensis TaxID=52695 RepID=A0A4R6JBK8_9ACTN|nr:helix-turn-helix domain-containing protein [Actinoplanes brasiliensis]TDO32311.1 TetR family transcriptional regulator [Actinoplanes brasiliensis]
MGRPRAFDEDEVVRDAAALFAGRAYDSVSVDDLVNHLGVHRNSLYKVFGSKRGLYLAALRHGLAGEGPGLDLLLLAMAERAPVDAEVAALVQAVLHDLDQALGSAGATATLLGDRLRARAAS